MDFEKLFADLTGQLDDELDRESRFHEEDEERQRQAKLTLIERIRLVADGTRRGSQQGELQAISVRLVDGSQLSLFPQTCGKDWFLAEVLTPTVLEGTALVSITSVESISLPQGLRDLSVGSQPASSERREPNQSPNLANQIGFGFVLRDLARRRSRVTVRTRQQEISGLVNRVGRDHLEISREGDETLLVPLTSVVVVQLP